jgi:hypothetical protein
MQIKVTKLSDRTIQVERLFDNGMHTLNEYPAQFRATGAEREDLVTLKEIDGTIAFSANYSDFEINGEVYASRQEAVIALNDFVGNFSSGGSSPSTTDVILSVTKSGMNGEITPSVFSWITGLKVIEVRLMSNAADITFQTGGESYDKDSIVGLEIPAEEELFITGIDIEAGENQANVIIIFKKIMT